jgi:hypothetical protein
MGNILQVEAAYNTFKKESELKSLRIVNKSVFDRLLQSTLSDCKRLVLLQALDRKRFSNPQMLLVNIDHVPTVSLPSISYCNFRIFTKPYPGSRGLFLLFSLRRGEEK